MEELRALSDGSLSKTSDAPIFCRLCSTSSYTLTRHRSSQTRHSDLISKSKGSIRAKCRIRREGYMSQTIRQYA
jgi:hypothetical protein